MAYAAVQDMIDRFGLLEIQQLAPVRPVVEPGYDATPVNRALSDASAELDSFLAIRFDVPLADVPELIKKFTCDLAREALDRTGRQNVLDAGKRARAWAKDVAQGRASLGSGSVAEPEAVPEAASGGAVVSAPDRVFDDAGLAGYLR